MEECRQGYFQVNFAKLFRKQILWDTTLVSNYLSIANFGYALAFKGKPNFTENQYKANENSFLKEVDFKIWKKLQNLFFTPFRISRRIASEHHLWFKIPQQHLVKDFSKMFSQFFQHATCRNSYQRCSIRTGVLRNFAKFTGKHPCQSLFLIKLQASGLQLY